MEKTLRQMIQVQNLSRSFGALQAVRGISFEVAEGEVFGLLGPNGAGKSTTIKMLVTLLAPHGGSIMVNGFDACRQKAEVRKSIGIIFQDPSLDDRLTAVENLYFHARLYHIPRESIQERIDHALEVMGLEDRAGSLVQTFSGGMKRRLEIARGILHTPKILFLDEPTLGLDPQTRHLLWKHLKQLQELEKLTIVLTTNYIEEAEICQRIAVLDFGRIIALDTPNALKHRLGSELIILETDDNARAAELIQDRLKIEAEVRSRELVIAAADGAGIMRELFGLLGGSIRKVDIHGPTLEDVFIDLTGRTMRDEKASRVERMRRAAKMRRRI